MNLAFKLERLATPCGVMLIATDDEGALRALDWQDHEARMRRLFDWHYGRGAVRTRLISSVSHVREQIEAYLAADLRALDEIPVATAGTAFQRLVWAALRTIPVGTTISYRQLAAQVRRPDAVRAVGMANGANPIGIVVPCHRVIGTDGSLTGYGGGIERKRWLLEHEGVQTLLQTRERPGVTRVLPGRNEKALG